MVTEMEGVVASLERLKDHYKHCIRLSASNKINPKNAFDLQLIDYMQDLVSTGEDGQMNFKIATSALDVGAKIYSNRVDYIQSEAQKVASSILMALDGKQQREDSDQNRSRTNDSITSDRMDDSHEGGDQNDDEDGNRKKKLKKQNRNRNIKTIVEDDTTLDGKIEKLVLGDPFLDSLSQDYDMSCPAALISYNALTQPNCLLTIESSHLRTNYMGVETLFTTPQVPSQKPSANDVPEALSTIAEEREDEEKDADGDVVMNDESDDKEDQENRGEDLDETIVMATSDDVAPSTSSTYATATNSQTNFLTNSNTNEQVDLVTLITKNVNCAQIIRNNQSNHICPRLGTFLFNDRTTVISGLDLNQDDETNKLPQNSQQPNNNATRFSGGEHEFDPKSYNDNADYGDDHFGDAASVMDDCENDRGSPDKPDERRFRNLDQIAATKPTEYCYSKEHHRILSAWAGPHGWKAAKAPLTAKKPLGLKSARKRTKLIAEPIDFKVEYDLKELEQIADGEIRHHSTTIRKWKKPLLPQDHNFEEVAMREIFKQTLLKPEDTYHCAKTPADAFKLVEKDHNYIEEAPSSPGIPGGFDDVHDDSDDEFRADPIVEGNEVAVYGAPINDTLTHQADLEFAGEHLIDQPYEVAQVNIPFAKIAKKMDVRKLKRAMWEVLLPPQSNNVTVLPSNGTSGNNTTFTNGSEQQKENTLDKTVIANEPSISPVHLEFSHLYGELPDKINSKMADDLSRPIAFVTLLHLANERNLKLLPKGDLKDFVIEQD